MDLSVKRTLDRNVESDDGEVASDFPRLAGQVLPEQDVLGARLDPAPTRCRYFVIVAEHV